MSVMDLWKGSLAVKAVTIVLCLMVFAFNVPLLFNIVGILILAAGCWMALRGGAAAGHAAAGVGAEIEEIMKTPEKRGQITDKMLRQAYSPSHGVAALFAGAIIDYVVNCVYIAMMLFGVGVDVLIFGRLASFAVSLPLWSIVSLWREVFNTLTPDVVIMLLAGPFLIPEIGRAHV